MWCEVRLWKLCVLQRIHISILVIEQFPLYLGKEFEGWCIWVLHHKHFHRLLLVCADIWMDMNKFFGHGGGYRHLRIGSNWCQDMKVIFIVKNCGQRTHKGGTLWGFYRFRSWMWDWDKTNWRWNCYSVKLFSFCCCEIILWEMPAAYEPLVQCSFILYTVVYAQSLCPQLSPVN